MNRYACILLLVTTLFDDFLTAANVFDDPFEAFPSNPDCPCIDSSRVLEVTSNCEVELSNGGNSTEILQGVISGNTCYPVTYGSKACSRHDLVADPLCALDRPTEMRPAYCDDPFCYVDLNKCKASSELFYRSDIFQGSEYRKES